MSIPYTFTTVILGIACVVVIFFLLRRNLLHPSYAFWWTGVAITIVLLGFFPQFFDAIAMALGVHYPPIFFVVVAVLIILVRLLMADIERTQMTIQIRRLAQKHAQLTHRLKALEDASAPPQHNSKNET